MNRRDPSRRDVLRVAGIGAGAWLVGCGDNETSRPPGAKDALALLEPTPNAFLVSLWAPLAQTALLQVQDARGLVLSTAIMLDAAGQAVFDVTNLAPSTPYEVTVITDDGVSLGPSRVRTAPLETDRRAVRLAVSADLDPSQRFESQLLEHASAAMPELYVSIGDFPYTDNGPPAMTVDEYRARHAELRTKPEVRTWMQSVGIRAIYDDHEFRNDWDGHFELVEADRFAAAMQVWDEFFPLRDRVGEVRYRSWKWGANVECFLLDCRRFRSANAAPDDAQKTMLGAVQHAWLVDGITRSTATFKLVFTSIPLAFGMGNDHWASFTTERNALFQAIVGVPGIVFFTGDQHFFAAYRNAFGIREFQLGPIARGLGTPPPLQPGVIATSARYNFGLIDADSTALTVSAVGADGEVFYKETLTAQQLTPGV